MAPTKITKVTVSSRDSESDNDSSSSDEDTKQTIVNKKVKPIQDSVKVETLEDDSEEAEEVSDNESDSES